MLRKVSILILLVVLGLSAEFWVNAIRDPGAELGTGDWETGLWEWPKGSGAGDSARVDVHDSTRAYEGNYSFLTDTDRNPGIDGVVHVWCFQSLSVPKAVRDIDSCFWVVDIEKTQVRLMSRFHILFHSKNGKNIRWVSGRSSTVLSDTLCSIVFPVPDSGVWTEYGDDFYYRWTSSAMWSSLDTIIEVQLLSRGARVDMWLGQEVSWDNVRLRSIAYYDYAAKSIDSDEQVDQSYTPIATFANEGIKDDIPGTVYAEILEGINVVYRDSLEVSIPAESSEQVEFKEWTVPHSGEYLLRVYPILELDEYSTDDTLEQALTGIGEVERLVDVELVTTRYTPSGVYFSLSPDIKGHLSIYDAAGRKVYTRSVNRGTKGLFWSTEDVPSGLYFYKIETPTSRLTDKLLILH